MDQILWISIVTYLLSVCNTSKSNSEKHNLLTLVRLLSVPFVESPKYAPQRRESARTLAIPHPHPFLRANSDSSMNLPDWMAVPNAPGTNIVSVQVCSMCGWYVDIWTFFI